MVVIAEAAAAEAAAVAGTNEDCVVAAIGVVSLVEAAEDVDGNESVMVLQVEFERDIINCIMCCNNE